VGFTEVNLFSHPFFGGSTASPAAQNIIPAIYVRFLHNHQLQHKCILTCEGLCESLRWSEHRAPTLLLTKWEPFCWRHQPIVKRKVFYSKLMFYKSHTRTLTGQTIT